MKEVWRPVVSWEGWYEVSSFGNIKRVKPGYGAKVGRILKTSLIRSTVVVGLRKNGQPVKRYPVGHLVLAAFTGVRPPDMEMCHLDDNPWNNTIENLHWGSRSTNMRQRYKNNPGLKDCRRLRMRALWKTDKYRRIFSEASRRNTTRQWKNPDIRRRMCEAISQAMQR